MSKKKRTYFISYAYLANNGRGFGNTEISCDKIKSYTDVREITKYISERNDLKAVIILFWTELK